MLAVTDHGAVASGEHVGVLGGEVLERGGRLVEVSGSLADELHAALADGRPSQVKGLPVSLRDGTRAGGGPWTGKTRR